MVSCADAEANEHSTAILCFGSSQAEVMDYVFHGDPRYVTNTQDGRVGYIGGASCRGLKKERNRAKAVEAVKDQLARQGVDNIVVFLAYGSVSHHPPQRPLMNSLRMFFTTGRRGVDGAVQDLTRPAAGAAKLRGGDVQRPDGPRR